MDYFAVVSSRLTLEDLEFLAYLSEIEADAPFKAVKNIDLIDSLPFTKFKYSKISTKLKALYFIDEVTGGRTNKIYITSFGMKALQKSLKGVIE